MFKISRDPRRQIHVEDPDPVLSPYFRFIQSVLALQVT